MRIEVRPPSPAGELAIELAETLGLRRAAVVPALAPGGGLQALVAPTLAELERLALRPGDVLAISWGSTVWEVPGSALPRPPQRLPRSCRRRDGRGRC